MVDRELLSVETGCSECNDAQDLILGVEAERSVQETLRIETGLLREKTTTPVRRVGRSCL